MLHWYMTNAEYRIYEPPELQLDSGNDALEIDGDTPENEAVQLSHNHRPDRPELDAPNSTSGSFIGALAGGLQRSLSAASRKGRSKSVRTVSSRNQQSTPHENNHTRPDSNTNNNISSIARPNTNSFSPNSGKYITSIGSPNSNYYNSNSTAATTSLPMMTNSLSPNPVKKPTVYLN